MKAVDVINNIVLFPLMILMGIFFGIRYIIREAKYFFTEIKTVTTKK